MAFSLKMAVLGCGHMGSALVKSIHYSHKLSCSFYTFTPTGTRAESLASEVSGKRCRTLDDIPPCDLYLIACKPQQFEEMGRNHPLFPEKALIISVMAGVAIQAMVRWLGHEKIVRAMPNLPVLVGEGVCCLYYHPSVDVKERDLVERIFSCSSKVFVLDEEKKIDLLTTVAGSGPAYVFWMFNIFCDYLKGQGIEHKMAEESVWQTFKGAVSLLNEEKNGRILQRQVTSKKGVTQAALAVLAEKNMENIWHEALKAALERTRELSLSGEKSE